LFKLSEALQAEAIRVHPYHHEVIGNMTDLQSMQRDDLYGHYRRYYVPNNAVLAIAGDFETQSMLDRVRELFEPIPAGSEPEQPISTEPPTSGERSVSVDGPGETKYIQVAHRAPAASNPDFFPLMVLDSLLTGPSNLNMFGGGISNKTSHLYRVLVDTELAIGVQGGLHATIDPFLHTITAIVHPEREAEEVIQALNDEVQRLQDNPPLESDLSRAVKQARALFAYGSESITSQAFWLGNSEMFANYDWFTNYLKNLAVVTPDDVQRVAQTYFLPQNRTVGVYIPDGLEGKKIND
jgi:zinc protease